MNLTYQFFTWTSVIASVILKLPQLMTVLQTNSVRGLTTSGVMLEMWSFMSMLVYQFVENMPFLQYIDYVFLMLQEVPLFFLVLYYNRHFNKWAGLYGAVFCAVFGSVAAGVSSHAFNTVLVNMCTPISAFSKLAQLMVITREKSSGSVSMTSWSLAAYACLGRMITLKMEMDFVDMSLMLNYGVAGILNVAIVMACLYYGSSDHKTAKLSPPVSPRENSPVRPKVSPRRSTRKAD